VRYASLVLILSLLAFAAPARAGGFSSASTSEAEATHFPPRQIVAFAKKVERTLAAKGARVAIVSRMGRPPSEMPPGMRFTHVAFAVYSTITTADGRRLPGYAIYNLYQRDDHPEISDLVQDYPVDFFAGVWALEAGVIVPSPALQRRLLKVIFSPTYAALHDPRYSVIANPYRLGRQNCTEFVLDVTNAALYGTGDMAKIKAREIAQFDAQKVDVDPIKLLLGSLFVADVSTADQDGPTPVTATFERIGDYLRKYDPGMQMLDVKPGI
jgi:hypothetical protein